MTRQKGALHLQTRVTTVSRAPMDKVKTPAREETLFVVRVKRADAQEQDILARAVIDASGTYQAPNPLGAQGLMALGEQVAGDYIFLWDPGCPGRGASTLCRQTRAGRREWALRTANLARSGTTRLARA